MKFSNKNLFNLYLCIRYFVLIAVLALIAVNFTYRPSDVEEALFEALMELAFAYITGSFVLVLLLEFYLNFSYLELSYNKYTKEICIHSFIPSEDYFIIFNKSKIKTVRLHKKAQLSYAIETTGLYKQLSLYIKEGEKLASIGDFNLFWARSKDLKLLEKLLKIHD